MFETEAEEYTENPKSAWKQGMTCVGSVRQAFKDGAEFGYNKADEWHYVKDELPPEDVPLICVRGGKIYVAWYYNGVYHDSRCCQVQKPYAWKEIVLPKEVE